MTVEAAVEEIKRIGVKDGDIVVVMTRECACDQFMHTLSKAVNDDLRKNAIVVNLTSGQKIEHLSIKNGDIVVLKTTEEISTQDRDDITRAIVGHLGLQVVVWFMLEDDTIETLDDEQMNALGWYRKP